MFTKLINIIVCTGLLFATLLVLVLGSLQMLGFPLPLDS